MVFFNWFLKENKELFDKGLEKMKEGLFFKFIWFVVGKLIVDDEVLDELEEVLIIFDVGVNIMLKIIKCIEECVVCDKYVGIFELNCVLW